MELSERILGGFYKRDAIHTKSVQRIGKGTVRVTYQFPSYHRTVEDMGHVGMSQMNEALVEGLYCAIGYAIESGDVQGKMDIASYTRRMAQALFMSQNISFRKMLKPGEEAQLTIEVVGIQEKMRGKYYAVTLRVQGFMRGEVECWLSKDEVVF
ncbi:MAG: hypothetical protein PHX87_00235 [Candidatus Peribacteraceae bacterium]|nr:hypothetical protein [Candidatus Peribacteraceae bacterium]MDD5741836.1 hypothetical protein [Candidatus Peribacteraceae bacterium]